MNLGSIMAPLELTFDQIKTRMIRISSLAGEFSRVMYRASTPKYSNEADLLSGEGSRRHSGRWNPVGVGVIYASLTPETAMAETLAHNRYYQIPVEDAMPRMFVAMEANLQRVLDLSKGDVRSRLKVSLERILKVDWRREAREGRVPVTWMIGHAAFVVGLEGLVVPSSADPEGQNLLVFPENLKEGSKICLLHPDRMTR